MRSARSLLTVERDLGALSSQALAATRTATTLAVDLAVFDTVVIFIIFTVVVVGGAAAAAVVGWVGACAPREC